jgi:pimeloyl-ACP methyl ester carboxylesterase
VCFGAAIGLVAQAGAQPAFPQAAVAERTACPFETDGLDTTRLQCGLLEVAEERRTSAGARLRLAFAVTHRRSTVDSRDAVVFIAGGPGMSALDPDQVLRFAAPALSERHDFVLFDQRGVGYSQPPFCRWMAGAYARIDALDTAPEETFRLRRDVDLRCLEEMSVMGLDPAAYHTLAIAEDLEDLRLALGYERWILVSTSYGGRVAAEYARTHPERVAAAAFLSPVTADWDTPLLPVVTSVRLLLRELDRKCRSSEECRRVFPAIEDEFVRALTALSERPMHVPLEGAPGGVFVVNAGDAVVTIDEMAALPFSLPRVPSAVRAFAERDAAAVARLLPPFPANPAPATQSVAMRYSVWCHDAVRAGSRAAWEAAARRDPLERVLGFGLALCEHWPSGPPQSTAATAWGGDAPVLIVSGGLDVRTPPSYAAELLRVFPEGRQVVLPGVPHAIPPGGAPCTLAVLQAFVDTPGTAVDVSCASGTDAWQIALDRSR